MESERKQRIKVLYIAGFERSGSTLVNRVFGQIDSFVAWGELRDIWGHGVSENRSCTCGTTFHNCEVWQKVLDYGFGGINNLNASRLIELLQKSRKYIAIEHVSPVPIKTPSEVYQYLDNLLKLYRAIQSVTGCRVIVDSTKASWYGAALKRISDIDIYTLHITRDPRGVCHSLKRRKQQGEPECQWYNPLHASLAWMLKNSAVESFLSKPKQKYMRMKFEDFVLSPKESVQSVLDMMDEVCPNLPFVEKDAVQMKTDHIFTGSPSSRSDVGNVQLKLDERWKENMNLRDKNTIAVITAPLRRKYQY
ncbi:MAG: sulfotransferase [Cyanobacteria bacterium J06636_16]